MNPSPSLPQTPRLLMREWTLQDAVLLYELNNDPEVIRFTGDRPFASVKEAEDLIRNYDQYRMFGMGRWLVVNKEDNQVLGWCGLRYSMEDHKVDIGFRFFQKYWGMGYATESAKACLEWGWKEKKLNTIWGRVAKENHASVHVLEKLGMKMEDSSDCHGLPAWLYKIKNPYV